MEQLPSDIIQQAYDLMGRDVHLTIHSTLGLGGVGGYVRRCERKPARVLDPIRPDRRAPSWSLWREPPSFQSMPILRFETFDVENDVDTMTARALRS